ncbi:hypothetical protein AB0J47_40760 [Nocardia sp. NPDC049737]|uniref:Low molecular weight antigen MTB12-like C-terminal domain-containing protein n=2 Tax=Nocardia TaxID=1817 RepID=A0ABZ1YQ47_9NOCA|nr:hypothetical protein [Nocardia vinacea]
MRDNVVRRTVAWCGIAAIAFAAVTGCSSDDKSSDSNASTATSSSVAVGQADAATTKAISDAYILFFDGKAAPDKRAAGVERGSEFLTLLQGQAADPQAQSTSVTVSAVKLTGAGHADVTYTLLMGGNPVLPDQTGEAIQEAGQWKVAATTYCALMALQGGKSTACG